MISVDVTSSIFVYTQLNSGCSEVQACFHAKCSHKQAGAQDFVHLETPSGTRAPPTPATDRAIDASETYIFILMHFETHKYL